MGTFFKILLFFFIAYFLYSWIRGIFFVASQKSENNKGVKIFKSKEVEKPTMDMADAETIDFEEIKEPKENRM